MDMRFTWLIALLASALLAYRLFGMRKAQKTSIPPNALVIDVRSAGEFTLGHIPSSRNIPVDVLKSQLSGLDKQQTIVVCCASGMRSAKAARILKEDGFAHVIDIGPWQNAA